MATSIEQASSTKLNVKRAAKAAVAVGLLVFLGPKALEAGSDVLGSTGSKLPVEQADNQAFARYESAFHAASPVGKFVLQYLRTSEVTVNQYPHQHGLRALWHEGSDGHWGDDFVWAVKVNNACLAGTAYDVAGGSAQAQASGLFSSASAEANIPTAAANAEINPNNPNELLVQSGHAGTKMLVFDGLQSGNMLEPVNTQTMNILATYGCETGVIKNDASNTVWDHSSDWIK